MSTESPVMFLNMTRYYLVLGRRLVFLVCCDGKLNLVRFRLVGRTKEGKLLAKSDAHFTFIIFISFTFE